MSLKFPLARIAVFTREPVLGEVKTRLHAAIGARRALHLQRAMTRRIVATVVSSKLAGLDLWVSSKPSHEFFLSLCNKKDIYNQNGDNLGAKMRFTSRQTLARAEVDTLLIIGTDCPAMSHSYLNSALTVLAEGNEVVIGPAEDGGYVLLGLRRHIPQLWDGIAWGTASVLGETLDRLQSIGLKYQLLQPLWDVDRPEDLLRLRQLEPPLIY